MTRSSRIAFEILSPPLVAFALALAFVELDGADLRASDLRELPGLLAMTYGLAGLPSLAFAVVMELAFWRGVNPRSFGSALLAAVLGAVAGLSMYLTLDVILGKEGQDRWAFAFFVLLGLATGFTVGLIVALASRLGRGRRRERPQLEFALRPAPGRLSR